MYPRRCEYNMVPVVHSSLLTQNPQFWLFSPQWYATFSPAILASCCSHCCSCCCHYFCFCSCLRCSLFAVLHYNNTYWFVFNQSPVPFSVVGSLKTRIPFDGETALNTACKNTCNDGIACLSDGYWSGMQWRSSAEGQSECAWAELIKAICLNASHGGDITSSTSAGHTYLDNNKRGKWTIWK